MATSAASSKKVSIKTTKENPFYGKRNHLDLLQKASKMTDSVDKRQLFSLLDAAWSESTDRTMKEMFYTMMFAFGDVSNRDHNLFKQKYGKDKIESGGSSLRKVFTYCMEWLVKNEPKQFYAFLPIIAEYTNLESPFYYQVRTDRKSGKVKEVVSIVPKDEKGRKAFIDKVAGYFVEMIRDIRTTDMQHQLLAKFIPKPKFGKRSRTVIDKEGKTKKVKYSMQKETFEKEMFERDFAIALSEKLKWEVVQYKGNTRFIGLEKYKAKHNRRSESYLFSSKEVLNMDKDQFHLWLDTLPSGARYRVQRRLFDVLEGKLCSTGKWVGKFGDLAGFYMEWMNRKEAASKEAKKLEVKEKTGGGLSDDEKVALKELKKTAKVNVGAESILDNIADLYQKNQSVKEFNLKVDSLLDKIKLNVPVLVIADVSGSMTSNSVSHKGSTFYPRDMARMIATTFLLKNPDPDLQNILVTFDNKATILTQKTKADAAGKNRFMSGHTKVVDSLVDPTKTFKENYENISQYIYSGGTTELTTVPMEMKRWVDENPAESEMRKEMINRYPVFLVISDGDINNSYNATASVNDFTMKMKQWFGWNGVLIIWDVKNPTASEERNKFENIENVVYYGSMNTQIVNQIFSNIDDVDVIDIYTPLNSLHRSNRYEPVRELVLEDKKK